MCTWVHVQTVDWLCFALQRMLCSRTRPPFVISTCVRAPLLSQRAVKCGESAQKGRVGGHQKHWQRGPKSNRVVYRAPIGEPTRTQGRVICKAVHGRKLPCSVASLRRSPPTQTRDNLAYTKLHTRTADSKQAQPRQVRADLRTHATLHDYSPLRLQALTPGIKFGAVPTRYMNLVLMS